MDIIVDNNKRNLEEIARLFANNRDIFKSNITLIPVHHFFEPFSLVDDYVEILMQYNLPYHWWAISPLTLSGSEQRNLSYAAIVHDKIQRHTNKPYIHILGKMSVALLSARPFTSFDIAMFPFKSKNTKNRGIRGFGVQEYRETHISRRASNFVDLNWTAFLSARAKSVSAIHKKIFGYSSDYCL